MTRVIDWYCRGLKWAGIALLMVMVALVFGNVVLRYAFNSGITVSEELSRWCFVWMTFLGSIVALREHQHLGTDVLLSRLSPALRRVCLLLGILLMMWVCWLLLSGAWAQTRLNWDVSAPSSQLSLAWFYMSGVVFGLSAAVVLVEQFISVLRGQSNSLAGEEQL